MRTRRRREFQRLQALNGHLVFHEGTLKHPIGERTPQDVRAENLAMVCDALQGAGVEHFLVRKDSPTRTALAVDADDIGVVLDAVIRSLGDSAAYASVFRRDREPREMLLVNELADLDTEGVEVIRLWRFYVDALGWLVYGRTYACDVELWIRGAENTRVAPRQNVAATILDERELEPVEVTLSGRTYPTARVFQRKMIDDIDFPIDVIYTWVDGSDRDWQERMRHFAEAEGDYHPDAVGPERFRSRDELRYSLRSLDMYAPWVRRVFLVTDAQRPSFLHLDDPRLTIVDHRDIATDPSLLPVFNGQAIMTWFNRIPGLSEHFLYLNDDFFFGRDTHPSLFFHPSGIAKVFPSRNRRPFGAPSGTERLIVTTSKLHRRILEEFSGRTLSRAIKHAPYAMTRSVLTEVEDRFHEHIEHTRRSKFRHREDIALDLFVHHYALITGSAVEGPIRYMYVNVCDEGEQFVLERLLRSRDRDVFCLNDDPIPGNPGIPDRVVDSFLMRYFPVPSRWERPTGSGCGGAGTP